VLLGGETGTGKELVARAIHDLSGRRRGSFTAVNCGELPDTLLEDEFFGHERGAFTDAKAVRAGLLSQADGGTLFLGGRRKQSARVGRFLGSGSE